MGLKITNYEIKATGQILPEAYALIKELWTTGDKGTAIFAIQESRNRALTLAPITTVKIKNFPVNRNENPFAAAYKAAKLPQTTTEWNRAEGRFEMKTVDGPFVDWDDDIIVVEDLSQEPIVE